MFRTALQLVVAAMALSSCQSSFDSDDYRAYFGGEIDNPLHPYVLFCKDGEVRDTLYLDAKNRFFKAFDSLTPGLYSFRHDPEYQYVYFDKNDSLLAYVNSREFDETLVYSGRGDQKNNYLMEVYLQNEIERNNMFTLLDKPLPYFTRVTDSMHTQNKGLYKKRKENIKWSADFDRLILASLNLPYYSKRELYPHMHLMTTGNDVFEQLPANFYQFRDKIDFNDKMLSNYAPYIAYLSAMLNNMSAINYHHHYTNDEMVLKVNLNKLHIADTMIRDPKVKNSIISNIAHIYFLEDQKSANNKVFLEAFMKLSTDKTVSDEISNLHRIIRNLEPGKQIPNIALIDAANQEIDMQQVVKDEPTVLFFWKSQFQTHYLEAFKRVQEFEKQYPQFQFIAINLDDDTPTWQMELERLQTGNVKHYRAKDFVELREKIAITRIHRTIVLQADGRIQNAFSSLFAAQFPLELKRVSAGKLTDNVLN